MLVQGQKSRRLILQPKSIQLSTQEEFLEHNDEELPEPGPGHIFWEDSYSEIGDSEDEPEIFTSEDAGPP